MVIDSGTARLLRMSLYLTRLAGVAMASAWNFLMNYLFAVR